MKVWVSKYALTSRGLYETTVTEPSPGRRYVWEQFRRGALTLGRDAHETREAAVADAERRRVAKIASLKRQIARLEALEFEERS